MCGLSLLVPLRGFSPLLKNLHWICFELIGQSCDFWRAYSLFMARVASFAPERSKGANDATIDTSKLYALQKSFDYHYYQYTRPNR